MEANPGEAVVQDESRSHNFFREVQWVDSMVLETVEVEATLFQLVDGNLGFALRLDVPVKIELPSRHGFRQISVFVAQSDSQLNDL